MTFYQYRQNNTGGEFYSDAIAGIGKWVIVEADSGDDADSRAESFGLYFDGVYSGSDCGCCGDRWHRTDSYDRSDVPSLYEEPIPDMMIGKDIPKDLYSSASGYIHYADGRVVTFDWDRRR